METIGRDPERGGIERWLAAPEAVLLIEGEAGIGKSTLWRAAVAEAEGRGYRVLACTAAGSETQLAFTTVRDLLVDVFDEVAEELPLPQRHALAVVLLREAPRTSPPDPGAIAVALLATLTILAKRGPTLIAVDDAQWTDDASAGLLAYALRRLPPAKPAVLLARRVDFALRPLESLPAERIGTVTLGPLSIGALARILHERLGTAHARPTLHRLHETSGGNPFYALELARALGEPQRPLAAAAALPVPPTLHQLVDSRLEALPAQTREALLVAAALARPTLATVGTALADEALPRLEPAIDAHVIDVQRGTLRFAHPLFAAAVYGLTPPSDRQELHRRLAEIASDPEERARHLALSTDGPDASIADALESAAAGARARIVAAELYEAAARLTPETDATGRARRALAGAAAEFDAGDIEGARASLEALLDVTPIGPERVDAQLLLGRILADVGSWEGATRLWDDALAATDDDSRVADIRSCMVAVELYTGRASEAVVHANHAVQAATRSANAERLAYAYAARAQASLGVGDSAYRGYLAEALELERDHVRRGSAWDWSPTIVAAACALRAFDIEEMHTRFGALYDEGRETGNADLEQYGAYGLAIASLATGELALADQLGSVVEELVDLTGGLSSPSQRIRAELEAHRGRAEAARAVLAALATEAEARGEKRHAWQVRAALGSLELADGAPAEAAAQLLAAHAITDDLGIREPWVLLALVDEVEAATEADLVDQADGARRAAERLGEPPEWAEPLLRRAEAILEERTGEHEEALATLESALTLESSSHLPLQHARTMLTLGRVQRRARKLRAARATLGRALETFERIGAELWAARTREELARIGGRSASSGELTAAEQRVAALVAEGKPNKEVAATLVVSVHTVEAALTSIYRKLDVHSRTEMARKLTAESKH